MGTADSRPIRRSERLRACLQAPPFLMSMNSPELLPILCYPDPRLHTVAKPVAAVDDHIRALIPRMLATMYDANGIGLAATQVDVHLR